GGGAERGWGGGAGPIGTQRDCGGGLAEGQRTGGRKKSYSRRRRLRSSRRASTNLFSPPLEPHRPAAGRGPSAGLMPRCLPPLANFLATRRLRHGGCTIYAAPQSPVWPNSGGGLTSSSYGSTMCLALGAVIPAYT